MHVHQVYNRQNPSDVKPPKREKKKKQDSHTYHARSSNNQSQFIIIIEGNNRKKKRELKCRSDSKKNEEVEIRERNGRLLYKGYIRVISAPSSPAKSFYPSSFSPLSLSLYNSLHIPIYIYYTSSSILSLPIFHLFFFPTIYARARL